MIQRITKTRFSGKQVIALLASVFMGLAIAAEAITIPHSFEAGDTARASEVNDNFTALSDAIDALAARVDGLEFENSQLSTDNAALTARVEELETKTSAISVVETAIEGVAGPNLVIEGVNVHVRSGSGATDDGGTLTGLGNLIVGYNEASDSNDRGGSHNVVLGQRNEFTSFSGIIAGADNRATAESASTLGGRFGTVDGEFGVIVGGGGATDNLFNSITGAYAVIGGGFRNVASGNQSAISGGSNHQATGFLSSISGGTSNQAVGAGATVSGGAGNIANGANSAISGGQGGRAEGVSSAVSGGLDITVTNNFDWAACDITCN